MPASLPPHVGLLGYITVQQWLSAVRPSWLALAAPCVVVAVTACRKLLRCW
jgi:hypothetical protein